MSELTLTVLRLGFLVLLWTFVLTLAGVMRTDLFGPRASGGRPARPAARGTPSPAKQPKPAKPRTSRRGTARHLTVVEGSLAGTDLTLGQSPITIGRSPDCTLVIDDDYASNHHARISPHDNGWVIEDLGSTNGTYVRSTRVNGVVTVPLSTPIRIGKTVLELRK
jgi:pSer/pThr/pTyr-binding forkhead associated (FHA) protein